MVPNYGTTDFATSGRFLVTRGAYADLGSGVGIKERAAMCGNSLRIPCILQA